VPVVSGYWALQSFSFTGRTGRTRERDLFVITPGGLHHMELKSHPGRAGREGAKTGLPGIWSDQLGRPTVNRRLSPGEVNLIAQLMRHSSTRLRRCRR
jgi:hypothetical protein